MFMKVSKPPRRRPKHAMYINEVKLLKISLKCFIIAKKLIVVFSCKVSSTLTKRKHVVIKENKIKNTMIDFQ